MDFERFGAHSRVAQRLFHHIQDQLGITEAATSEIPGCREHVLMAGLTGSGKTHLLRELLRCLEEQGIKGYYASCPTLFTGETASTEGKLAGFLRSPEYKVVVLDDVDAIASRPRNATGSEVEHRVFCVLKDGLDMTRAVVIGATLRPEAVDEELCRSGRFSTHLTVSIFSPIQREIILRETISGNLLDKDEIHELASRTHGYNASDLQYLYTEAFKMSLAELPKFSHFVAALERIKPTTIADMPLVRLGGGGWDTATCLVGIEEIRERIVTMIRLPIDRGERIEALRVRLPRGVLLYGPPGTGKTSLALECARLSGLNVFHIQSTHIRSKYVGESEKNLVMLFQRAKACAPCILLLDQLDTLFAARGGAKLNDRLTACMLTELDGLAAPSAGTDGVFILATALDMDAIDRALLRPGRIGHHFRMPDLDADRRRQFIEARARHIPLELSPAQRDDLIDATEGYSGAQLEGLFREAAMRTLRRDLESTLIPFDVISQLLPGRR